MDRTYNNRCYFVSYTIGAATTVVHSVFGWFHDEIWHSNRMHNTLFGGLMHVGSPGIVATVYPYPGWVVFVPQSYRSNRSSGYGTEVLQNSQNFQVLWHGRTELTYITKMIYPYPGYLWHWRTELPEVPGTGMSVIHNFQEFPIRVWIPTKLTEVLCTIPKKNTPRMVCAYQP